MKITFPTEHFLITAISTNRVALGERIWEMFVSDLDGSDLEPYDDVFLEDVIETVKDQAVYL